MSVMENKKSIPLIALALFSIVTLLANGNIQKVYALSATDIVFNATNLISYYQESIDTFVTLQKTTATSSTQICFTSAGTEDGFYDSVCRTINPTRGGCTGTEDIINSNPCSATSATRGSADCDLSFSGAEPCSTQAGVTGDFKGLWCGQRECFVLFDLASGTWSSQLLRVTSLGANSLSSGDIDGYMNITNTFVLHGSIWGYDECNGEDCGIGGITLYWAYSATTATAPTIVKTGGTLLMGNTQTQLTTLCTIASCPTVAEQTFIEGCRHCHDNISITRLFIAQGHATGAVRNAVLYSDTFVEQTAYTPNLMAGAPCNGVAVGGASTNTGFVKYMGDTINKFMYNSDTGFILFNATSGAWVLADCKADASFPYVDYVRGIQIDEDEGIYYVWSGSTGTLGSLSAMNLTTITGTVDLDTSSSSISHTVTGWVDGGQPFYSIAMSPTQKSLLVTSDSSFGRIYYLEGFEDSAEPETPPTVGGIDCDLPANANILICRIGGDGNEIRSLGNATGEALLDLGCTMPFIDCVSDDNPRNNGLGLMIYGATIFVVVGMFYYTIGKDAFHMPMFIWIMILIAITAFFTITGLIDPVFIILAVLGIIALAAPKLVKVVSSGNTFGSGSTE